MTGGLKLLGTENSKTIKGEKYGYKTFILYMSPNILNDEGKNLCPMATEGCKKSCLFTAGMGKFTNVERARINKANYFIRNRKNFVNDLYFDILLAQIIASRENLIPVFRLNGTTDIQWESIKMRDNKNVFQLFPDLQFYDYTKIVKRFNKNLPENYSLTFSYSREKDYYNGQIDNLSIKLLKKDINVAVVFRNELPKTYLGFPVVNGDESDLRFNDYRGVIVGLKAKGEAKKDNTGFVIDIEQRD
jgi:hypothetical protein